MKPQNLAIHSKFRNLGNSIPIKELTKGMSGIGSLLDAVQLANTLRTAGVRSPQVSVLWGTVKHIRKGSRMISLLHSSGRSKVPLDVQRAVSRSGMSVRKLSLYTPVGRKAAREGEGDWARSIRREFPIQIEAPINDSTAIHECTRIVGRLRQAFQATMAVHDDHRSESLALERKVSSTKEVTRLKRKVSVEDPIRTIMFLASWSNT